MNAFTADRHLSLAIRMATLVILGAGTLANDALAQQMEEIVVTAQRREQRQQDVGISVTALSGQQVKQLNLRAMADIASQTPSLTVASPLGTGGNQNFTLRGVGLNDFSEHNESPVAAYQDGVYQATIAGINSTLFDVERIEVLRGPQGTLYGRNTTGGLVHVFSRQPTDSFEGFADLDVGRYDTIRFEGAFGGPISERLLGRVAALYDYHDGWGESTIPGVDSANGSDMFGARVLLKFLASDDTSILFNGHAATNHTTGPAYTHLASMFAPDGISQIATPADVVNPTCGNVFGPMAPGQDCFGYRSPRSDPWTTDNNREPFQNLDTYGGSITVDSKFGSADFTSITAYEGVHKLYGEDTDAGFQPGIAVTNPVESTEWTQEFRLAGKTDRTFWTAGLYYFYRNIEAGSDTDVSGFGFVDDDFNDELTTNSASAFGQLEFAITPAVTLIGGVRVTYEDQEFSLLSVDHTGLTPVFLGITTDPVPDYNVFPFTGGTTADHTPYQDDRQDTLVTYRGEINWKPVDDVLLYGSVAKGTKSAGWNGAIDGSPLLGPSTEEDMPYDAEDLLAYEVGFKYAASSAYRLNAALFYYDYKDFQAFTFAGLVQQIDNRPASVKGAEIEFVTSPVEGLDITLGGSYLDTEVEGVTTAIVGSSPLQTVTRNREMVLAPEFTLNGIVRYSWPIGDSLEMSAQVDGRYVGEQYFDLGNNPITHEDGYAVGNASIGLSASDDRWSVSAWVKNFSDEKYRLYAIPVTGLGFTQQMFGPPRWYGVTLGYRW